MTIGNKTVEILEPCRFTLMERLSIEITEHVMCTTITWWNSLPNWLHMNCHLSTGISWSKLNCIKICVNREYRSFGRRGKLTAWSGRGSLLRSGKLTVGAGIRWRNSFRFYSMVQEPTVSTGPRTLISNIHARLAFTLPLWWRDHNNRLLITKVSSE